MNWYYKFLVRWPFLVVLAITVLSLACIIVSLTTKDLPDFSEPTLGFEARGTSISQRLTAWHNLLHETSSSGRLIDDPADVLAAYNVNKKENRFLRRYGKKNKKNRKDRKKLTKNLRNHENFGKNLLQQQDVHSRDYEIINETSLEIKFRNETYEFGWNTSFVDEDEKEDKLQSKIEKWNLFKGQKPTAQLNDVHMHVPTDGFFCESPVKGYSHFVIERIGPNSTDTLFDINSLLAMCQLDEQIQAVKGYENYCQKENLSDNCCRSWSLSNYIALLSKKSSCFDINQEDVTEVLNLLYTCFEYFHNFKLSSDCTEYKCPAPIECQTFNAVFNIFHYLTDSNFIKINDTNIYLKNAMIFVPIAQSTKILPFFHDLEKTDLKNDIVQVVAMDLGLKNALFDEMLLSDGWLVALGGIFVMACMWLYTSSLFVTAMTVIAVLFSLGIAYFIYTLVFEMTFFPFMNLLAVVVIIGIGADDAFIFVKIWQCTLREGIQKGATGQAAAGVSPSTSFSEQSYTETLNYLMATTFRHAAISMFVTSLTTAGAFYTSIVSSITSVKCFGIFAGTAVISNYLLMITWLPASVSIMERIPCHLGNFFSQNLISRLQKSINTFGSTLEDYILNAVLKVPVFWILLLGSYGICSCVIVLYWPSLQLPNSSDFQLFVSEHPFEIYDSKFKDLFWFEKSAPSIDNPKLPLRFVWGILPMDDGDYSNPYSRGDLHFDNNFNISSVESQIWLLNFCKKLRRESFYHISTFSFLLPNCFIENFISWMNRKCFDQMDNADRTPCCEISKFPFEPHVFDLCLPQSISSLYATPREFFIPGVAGPKFVASTEAPGTVQIEIFHTSKENNSAVNNKNNNNHTILLPPKVKALVIEFESNFTYSMSYSDVQKFVTMTQNWFDKEMISAPIGMQGGWFISELEFFDLQDTLSKGTIFAICVAMGTSLLVLLTVTLNVLISLYAVVTVTFTIFTTVAILILLGWKLNILESVSVSTAIGLAVDFSLHYGIHYRLSPNGDRSSSTAFALSRIIGPTSMAALTTGIAGAIMLASNVLPYIQIGIFLVVVMSVSWLYATFFLMSLLKCFGPQYGFMQFTYPKFKKSTTNNLNGKGLIDRKQSQVIATEQLLTPASSTIGELLHSESHELDSLTSNSLIKQMSDCSRPSIDYERALHRKSVTSKDFPSPSSVSAITVVLPEDSNVKV